MSIIQASIELTRRIRAYAIRVATLQSHRCKQEIVRVEGAEESHTYSRICRKRCIEPSMLQHRSRSRHMILSVKASSVSSLPKSRREAGGVVMALTVPTLGTARSGRERSAPMVYRRDG